MFISHYSKSYRTLIRETRWKVALSVTDSARFMGRSYTEVVFSLLEVKNTHIVSIKKQSLQLLMMRSLQWW